VTWRDIAYKDVHDASRSRTLWLLSGFMLVVFVGYAVGHGYGGEERFVAFLDGLVGLVGPVLPLLGIFLGYRSVADDRTSGSLLLSLSFPHSRRDLVAGTAAGRGAVLLVPAVVTLSLAGIAGGVQYGTDGALMYWWFLLVTALYGVAFVAVGIALSVTTTTERRITLGAVGLYLLLVHLWGTLVTITISVLHRFDPGVSTPDWVALVRLLQPTEAYDRLLRAGFDIERAGQFVGDAAPVYVDWWAALLVLVAWVVVPLALGYRRFATADL
jgi:ABC-type transport system involved in multi-copper enzyme maturation permease subunit